MSAAQIRCPLCVAVMPPQGFLSSFWPFNRRAIRCKACGKTVSLRDARVVGQTFAVWLRNFKSELRRVADLVPILPQADALRVILPGLDIENVTALNSVEALSQLALQIYRPHLNDKARGREAQLDVVMLSEEGVARGGAVLGQLSSQTGEQAIELIFTSVGRKKFLAYQSAFPSPRVHDAVRAKHHGSAALAYDKISPDSLSPEAFAATRDHDHDPAEDLGESFDRMTDSISETDEEKKPDKKEGPEK